MAGLAYEHFPNWGPPPPSRGEAAAGTRSPRRRHLTPHAGGGRPGAAAGGRRGGGLPPRGGRGGGGAFPPHPPRGGGAGGLGFPKERERRAPAERGGVVGFLQGRAETPCTPGGRAFLPFSTTLALASGSRRGPGGGPVGARAARVGQQKDGFPGAGQPAGSDRRDWPAGDRAPRLGAHACAAIKVAPTAIRPIPSQRIGVTRSRSSHIDAKVMVIRLSVSRA